MCSGSVAGSYLKPIDSYITQLKAQGPSRTCGESKEEEGEEEEEQDEEDTWSLQLLTLQGYLSNKKLPPPLGSP